jgi:hypothetical protein
LEFDAFGQFWLKFFVYIFGYVLGRGTVLLKIIGFVQRRIVELGHDIINRRLEFVKVHHNPPAVEPVAADISGDRPVMIVFRFGLRGAGSFGCWPTRLGSAKPRKAAPAFPGALGTPALGGR